MGCRTLKLAAVVVWGALAPGCIFLRSVEREYVSNRAALEGVSEACAYEVDPEAYSLVAVDVREDTVTFQYRGLEHPGDAAWVVRFSQKSSEQDPEALADPHAFVPVLAEGREDFEIVDDGAAELGGRNVRYVAYRFSSSVRADDGTPLGGRGVLTTLRADAPDGNVLVYQIKLDNFGDRGELTIEELTPFVEAVR